MKGEPWFIEWAPHVLFAAVLMGGAFIIRRRRGRGALPLFGFFLLLACISSFVLARAIGSSDLRVPRPATEEPGSVPNWFGFVALVLGFVVTWLVVRRRRA